MYDVAIIGCGVVGAAVAYELSRYALRTVVLERENDVAAGTSKANSAILHAGYDPHPGSAMARLNVEGARLAKELCAALDVPYNACGSLVVAFSNEELVTLGTLFDRGRQNGVEALAILNAQELRALEPNLSEQAMGALYAPTAAIVSPWELTLALAESAVRGGVELRRSSGVTDIRKIEGGYALSTSSGEVETRFVVNAAGVDADTVHNMITSPAFELRADRGEYFLLDKNEGTRVRHVVFQCPTAAGKGVLVAPTVHGNLIVGPNNEPDCGRTDLATTMAGLDEVRAAAQKSVPSISFRDNIRNFSGLRAVATGRDDFIIGEAEGVPGFVDLAGIKSPGLTSAPAIAVDAVEILRGCGLETPPNPDFVAQRKHVRFAELSESEKTELVAREPAYGRVICRCMTVTEGEILDALKSPIPPLSVDAVKRRCGAGMGRCQGGFCSPRVVEILARERGVSPIEIAQDGEGSYLLCGETKGGMRHV